MECAEFEGCETLLEKPSGWDDEKVRCGTLPIMRTEYNGVPFMESVWVPSDEEREFISKGGNVILRVVGRIHPPVSVEVTDRTIWGNPH